MIGRGVGVVCRVRGVKKAVCTGARLPDILGREPSLRFVGGLQSLHGFYGVFYRGWDVLGGLHGAGMRLLHFLVVSKYGEAFEGFQGLQGRDHGLQVELQDSLHTG